MESGEGERENYLKYMIISIINRPDTLRNKVQLQQGTVHLKESWPYQCFSIYIFWGVRVRVWDERGNHFEGFGSRIKGKHVFKAFLGNIASMEERNRDDREGFFFLLGFKKTSFFLVAVLNPLFFFSKYTLQNHHNYYYFFFTDILKYFENFFSCFFSFFLNTLLKQLIQNQPDLHMVFLFRFI